MPMNTMLVTKRARLAPAGSPSSRRSVWSGQSPMPVAGDDRAAPTISAAVRLRTRRCVPVWQNEQVSVQPTWLETQSVPRSRLGDVDALDLGALVVRARRRPCGSATCGCRPSRPARRRPRADRACRPRRARRAGPCRHWSSSAKSLGAAKVDPVPELRGAHLALALGHADRRRAAPSARRGSGRRATGVQAPPRRPAAARADRAWRCRATRSPSGANSG